LKKIAIVIGSVIGLILLLFIAWNFVKSSLYHTKISLNEVENVTLQQLENEIILTEEQQKEVVKAFNSAKFMDDNDRLAGPTYECRATIHLKTGMSIGLLGCGEITEVQREDNVGFGNKSLTGRVAYFVESIKMEQIFGELIEKK
jgi:sortase (surface protein transpeptidase)